MIIKSSFFFLSFGTILSRSLSFLIVPALAIFLSYEELARIDIILSSMLVLNPLVNLQMNEFVFKYSLSNKGSLEEVVSTSFTILLISTVISSILYLIWSKMFRYGLDFDFLLIMILSSLWPVVLNVFRALKRLKMYAFLTLLFTVLYIGSLVIAKVFYTLTSESALASIEISYFFSNTLGFVLIKRAVKIRISITLIREAIKYSCPLIFNSLLFWLVAVANRYLLSAQSSSYESASYALFLRVGAILVVLANLLYMQYQAVTFDSKNIDNKWKYIGIWILISVFLFLSILTKFFVQYLYDDSYVYDIWVWLLYLSLLLQSIGMFTGVKFQLANKTKHLFISSLLGVMAASIYIGFTYNAYTFHDSVIAMLIVNGITLIYRVLK